MRDGIWVENRKPEKSKIIENQRTEGKTFRKIIVIFFIKNSLRIFTRRYEGSLQKRLVKYA